MTLVTVWLLLKLNSWFWWPGSLSSVWQSHNLMKDTGMRPVAHMHVQRVHEAWEACTRSFRNRDDVRIIGEFQIRPPPFLPPPHTHQISGPLRKSCKQVYSLLQTSIPQSKLYRQEWRNQLGQFGCDWTKIRAN